MTFMDRKYVLFEACCVSRRLPRISINMRSWDYLEGEEITPPRPSENDTLRHITVGRAAIATPPEPI